MDSLIDLIAKGEHEPPRIRCHDGTARPEAPHAEIAYVLAAGSVSERDRRAHALLNRYAVRGVNAPELPTQTRLPEWAVALAPWRTGD